MTALLRHAGDVLRGGQAAAAPAPARCNVLGHLGLLVFFGASYGAVMGCFGGVGGSRALQPLYSGIKVPLLLVTFALSLPSFFVLTTLLGVRDDFPRVLRGLAATQAGLTVVLASMAPLTAFWYASSGVYRQALAFNALAFGTASVAAQFLLRRRYRPLVRRNPRHRILLRACLVIYAFVGIQTGWVLRPFVGHPAGPTHFFRPDAGGTRMWKSRIRCGRRSGASAGIGCPALPRRLAATRS
jgi:hypothetical protein